MKLLSSEHDKGVNSVVNYWCTGPEFESRSEEKQFWAAPDNLWSN